jgi:trk system potassium uptake protein TrkH
MTPLPGFEKRSTWTARMRHVVPALAVAALVSLCLEYGFERPPISIHVLVGVQITAIAAYLVTVAAGLRKSASWRTAVRRHWLDLVLIVAGAYLVFCPIDSQRLPMLKLGAFYVGAIQILLVLRVLAGAVRWNLEMSKRKLHPSRLLVTSFAVVIVVGGCLLSLPKAVAPDVRTDTMYDVFPRIVRSFFTATSATCVTGLAVYDTGRDFTFFGQVVILVLIQLGGLGIMISSTLFGVLMRRQLSLRQSLVLQDALSRQTVGRMGDMIRFIVLTTFICEIVGAALCYPMFADTIAPLNDRLFQCVFHAVSAFCNAGFGLRSDSLVGYSAYWGVYTSIMPLIVLGGLGFPVLHDLWGWCAAVFKTPVPPLRRAFPARMRLRVRGNRHRLGLHTKLVLVTTAILIVVPAVLFFAFESYEWRTPDQISRAGDYVPMVELPFHRRAAAALFQSVTARTAGFNTVSLESDALSPASCFLLMVLMFIGGSPASTAGGVKTVAVAVLTLGVVHTLRRRVNVEAFGRTIPNDIVERAAVVVAVMIAVVSTGVLALCTTETADFRGILFEVVSACGTVGLSTGLTPHLTIAGQIIIMLAMFAGRLGPLTIMIALAGRSTPARYEYPPEQVSIG